MSSWGTTNALTELRSGPLVGDRRPNAGVPRRLDTYAIFPLFDWRDVSGRGECASRPRGDLGGHRDCFCRCSQRRLYVAAVCCCAPVGGAVVVGVKPNAADASIAMAPRVAAASQGAQPAGGV